MSQHNCARAHLTLGFTLTLGRGPVFLFRDISSEAFSLQRIIFRDIFSSDAYSLQRYIFGDILSSENSLQRHFLFRDIFSAEIYLQRHILFGDISLETLSLQYYRHDPKNTKMQNHLLYFAVSYTKHALSLSRRERT
jgi:hypothetical protein